MENNGPNVVSSTTTSSSPHFSPSVSYIVLWHVFWWTSTNSSVIRWMNVCMIVCVLCVWGGVSVCLLVYLSVWLGVCCNTLLFKYNNNCHCSTQAVLRPKQVMVQSVFASHKNLSLKLKKSDVLFFQDSQKKTYIH